jgi:hypothetical protein
MSKLRFFQLRNGRFTEPVSIALCSGCEHDFRSLPEHAGCRQHAAVPEYGLLHVHRLQIGTFAVCSPLSVTLGSRALRARWALCSVQYLVGTSVVLYIYIGFTVLSAWLPADGTRTTSPCARRSVCQLLLVALPCILFPGDYRKYSEAMEFLMLFIFMIMSLVRFLLLQLARVVLGGAEPCACAHPF